MDKPRIASAQEWQQARDELLTAEKQATRTLDAIAARRRRLPMVKFRSDYEFASPFGTKSLLDLFDGRPQLAAYQFMDNGPGEFCPGCTHFTNNVVNLVTLADDEVSWVTASDMPLDQMEAYWARMGWTVPFVSSRGTTFAHDGDDVYRTYHTTQRGVDRLLFVNNMLDLAPYGRQQDWEDSPPGWPQHPTYG
jgi:predicted dithiol-disulfide oxidoreductase (DUF899 family)